MESSPGARLRGFATVFVTLVIVLAEFGFLTGVYHSDDGADRRHEAYVRVDGTLAAWQSGDPTAAVQHAVAHLVDSGAVGSARLQQLTSSWAKTPGSSALARVRASADAIGTRLADAQRWADLRAALIHGRCWCWSRSAGSSGSASSWNGTGSSSAP